MARVFLSYARADVDCAKALAELIGRAGHDVWWDRELHGGSHFTAENRQGPAGSRSCGGSLVRGVAQIRLGAGRSWPKDAIPTGWCRWSSSVRPPLGFRQYQAIDLADLRTGSPPRQLEELLRAIIKMGAPEVRAAPAEAPPAAPRSPPPNIRSASFRSST